MISKQLYMVKVILSDMGLIPSVLIT